MRKRNDSTLALPATTSQDVLTGILRAGAQRMLAQAIEAEVTEWIESHCELRDAAGRRQVVRNGWTRVGPGLCLLKGTKSRNRRQKSHRFRLWIWRSPVQVRSATLSTRPLSVPSPTSAKSRANDGRLRLPSGNAPPIFVPRVVSVLAATKHAPNAFGVRRNSREPRCRMRGLWRI